MPVTVDQRIAPDDPRDLDVAPFREVSRLITGNLVARAIYAACKIGVFDACATSPATAEDLGATCGADPDALSRYLRVLAAHGLLVEDDHGRFDLTEGGDLLRSDTPGSLAPFALLAAELLEPTAASVVHAVQTGTSAFAHSHGCGLYEHLATHPELEALFAQGMSTRAARLHAALVGVVDWTGVRHVIDVGGNHGAFLAAILQHLPEATGVLLDQPQVVAGAGPALTEAGVADRVDVEPGDFFTAVPPGGDLYLLANVLWNWPDDDSLRLLRRCRDALAQTARLVICEPVLPAGNGLHPAKVLDLANFWLNGGCTRSAAQWNALLDAARLAVTGITETSVGWSVIEARPC
jgi:SAM-dependent methyltransferase